MSDQKTTVVGQDGLYDAATAMLGFPPSESMVVFLMAGARVEAVGRVDLAVAAEQPEAVVGQMLAVRLEALSGALVCVVSEDVEAALQSAEVALGLLSLVVPVEACVVTDGARWWPLEEGALGEGRANAGYELPMRCGAAWSRDEAVADMLGVLSEDEGVQAVRWRAEFEAFHAGQVEAELVARACALGELEALSGPQSVELGVLVALVGVELADVVAGSGVPGRWRAGLASAFRWGGCADVEVLLWLLGVASWRGGSGAHVSEVVRLLVGLGSPLGQAVVELSRRRPWL